MWICLNIFVLGESREQEPAKSARQIHVKAKMRSSWWEEKRCFLVCSTPPPFLPDAEAAARFPCSDGVCIDAQWPQSSLMSSVSSCNSNRVFRWLHPKIAARCYWCWDGKSASLHCSMLWAFCMTKASVLPVLPSFLLSPSACSIPSLSLLGAANVSTYSSQTQLMHGGWKKDKLSFVASCFLCVHVFLNP